MKCLMAIIFINKKINETNHQLSNLGEQWQFFRPASFRPVSLCEGDRRRSPSTLSVVLGPHREAATKYNCLGPNLSSSSTFSPLLDVDCQTPLSIFQQGSHWDSQQRPPVRRQQSEVDTVRTRGSFW